MALELTKLGTDFGVELEGVYAKVIFFAIDIPAEQIGINIGIYANKAAADNIKSYLKNIQIGIGPQEQVLQAEVLHPVTKEVIVPKITMPSYAQVAKSGAGALAFDSVKAIIYALIKSKHPLFAGTKDV